MLSWQPCPSWAYNPRSGRVKNFCYQPKLPSRTFIVKHMQVGISTIEKERKQTVVEPDARLKSWLQFYRCLIRFYQNYNCEMGGGGPPFHSPPHPAPAWAQEPQMGEWAEPPCSAGPAQPAYPCLRVLGESPTPATAPGATASATGLHGRRASGKGTPALTSQTQPSSPQDPSRGSQGGPCMARAAPFPHLLPPPLLREETCLLSATAPRAGLGWAGAQQPALPYKVAWDTGRIAPN